MTVGQSRPIHLNDAQARDLAAGKPPSVGDVSRPRAFTPKHIEALRKGEDIKIEEVSALKALGHTEAPPPATGHHSRPRDVSDKDVVALREGKDIGIEKREQIKAREGASSGYLSKS